MKKIFCTLLVFLLISSALFSSIIVLAEDSDPKVKSSESYEGAYRYNVNGWIYLRIEGHPYERGFQHGYLLAAETVDMITRWSNVIHNSPLLSLLPSNPDSSRYDTISNAWWNFVRSRIKRTFWDRYIEEYKQEIQGIADGVNAKGVKFRGRDVDYLDILASNEMYEFMTRFDNPMKGFHPIKDLYGLLKDLVPMSIGDEGDFVKSFLNAEPAHHCNGFIATGDATTNGQMVVSQGVLCGGWWYPYYIPQRWNVIIDVVPTDGCRFMMSSAPGYIWSDQNYYQNEKGIVFVDTTCIQGLWRDGGYPMAIRNRLAAQYSESIDDVLTYLRYKNDGIWTAVYLVGDIKTGEVARMDLGLYKSEVWRTFNGYYWTANNAISSAVRAESYGLGIKGGILHIVAAITGLSTSYEYMTRKYIPSRRDIKYEELGERLYGEIDLEVLKNKIMTAPPIGSHSVVDVKLANTRMIENMSMEVFFGNVCGYIWDMSSYENTLKGVNSVPAMGWVKIPGLPEDFDFSIPLKSSDLPSDEFDLIWTYDFADDFEGRNMWNANLASDNHTLFAACSNGKLYALNARYRNELWDTDFGDENITLYVNAENDLVTVGWENGTCAFNQTTGDLFWMNEEANMISSKPVFINNMVIVGSRGGKVFALDLNDSEILWQKQLNNNDVYLAVGDDNIIVAAGNGCYNLDKEGNIDWEYKVDNDIVSSPVVKDGNVYFGSFDTKMYVLDAETGEYQWDYETGWGISTIPAVTEDMIYLGSMDNFLYALDVGTGKREWVFNCNAAIRSSPLVYGEYVLFGSDDGWFYAVNKTSGELVWRFAPGHTIEDDTHNYFTTSIATDSVVEDRFVFIGANGMIYALDTQTYEPSVKDDEKNGILELSTVAWIFIIGLLAVVVLGTAIYLIVSRRKK